MFKIIFVISLLIISLNATTIKEAIQNTLLNNPEINALQQKTSAYRFYIDEEQGNYLPTISLDAYLEDKNTVRKYADNRPRSDFDQDGYNVIVSLTQPLYDGGQTKAKVAEAKYNFQKTKIEGILKIEDAIFTAVDSYLMLVKFEELYELSKHNLLIHENYLGIAKQSEEVSGEILDRIQVESKLSYAHSKYVQMKNDKESSSGTFYRMTLLEPKGFICRPEIDLKKIPTDVNEAIKKSLTSNYTILAQIESFKAQREIYNQEKSRYLPSFSLQLSEEIDHELDTADIHADIKSIKFKMSYNLFNGLKDYAVNERERIFLNESQKVLDDTTNGIVESVKIAHSTFMNTNEKINFLKTYVAKNKEILKIYKEQFLGGTRTFIDILNNEAELFRAKTELIEEEFKLYNSYYQLMLLFSNLSNDVLSSENQVCHAVTVDKEEIIKVEQPEKTINELDGLLEESLVKEPIITEEENKKIIINEMLDNLMLEIYDKKEYKKQQKMKKEDKQDKTDGLDEFTIEKTNDTNMSPTVVFHKKIYSLKDVILNKQENYYTIVLATVEPTVNYNEFIKDNHIENNTVAYNFGQKDKFVKIIYGAYKAYEEAFEALIRLDTNILANRPYVEKVNKHIKLFHKYNNTIGE